MTPLSSAVEAGESMNPTLRKAVKAGVKAACAMEIIDNPDGFYSVRHAEDTTKEDMRRAVEAVIRAALPIIAGIFEDDLYERALVYDKGLIEGHIDRCVAEELRDRAAALRLKIEEIGR